MTVTILITTILLSLLGIGWWMFFRSDQLLSVASEYFFSQPHLFERNHPDLFAMMEKIFRQDLSG